MAMCLGHRYGTGCKKVRRGASAENWTHLDENGKRWQLCFSCANKLHPEYYVNLRHHGTGGTYMDAPSAISSMIEVYSHLNKRK